MQYIEAEGVTESGKNWFQLKSVGWKGVFACLIKMEGKVLC